MTARVSPYDSGPLKLFEPPQYVSLALAIERDPLGVEMTPCSVCSRSGRRCIMLADSKRCSECIRQCRSSCDAFPTLPRVDEWASLDRQQASLQAEEEEAMAKILRLRKQQRLLAGRRHEMVLRGLRSLDELDAELEKEKSDKERKEQALLENQASPGNGEPSSSTSGVLGGSELLADQMTFDPSLLDAQLWEDLGISGRTP